MNQNDNIRCYVLEIGDKFIDEIKGLKELKNIYQLLKRVAESNQNYSDISFIVGLSNTKSDTAYTYYKRKSGRGRPKKIIGGIKIDYHFHIYVITIESPIAGFCFQAKKRLDKKFKSVKYSLHNNPENGIKYLKNQSNNTRKYGNYFKTHF